MSKRDNDHHLEEFIKELGLSEDEIVYWNSYEIVGLGLFYHEFGEAAPS